MPLKSSFSEASKGKGMVTIGLSSSVLGCNVQIVVQENSTPNATHMVVIDGVNYKDGDVATLDPGIHDLTWASGNGGIFSSWSTSGNIEAADPSAEETELEVTCGGTLTLNLVACPSGEQITNGGFETGDLTGWSATGAVAVTDAYAHSGSKSCFIYSGELQQDVNIHQACITSFGFWTLAPHGPPYGYARIYYSDDTYTQVTIDSKPSYDWVYHDLLPLVAEGKRVVKIYFYGSTANPYYVDDVSLVGS